MNLSAQLATHLRQVFFGGNWTSVNLTETLAGITWQQATTQLYTFNTVATLVYHINYYLVAVTAVLQGGTLNASDKLSFSHPPIKSAQEWEALVDKTMADAERFAGLVEQLPDGKHDEIFCDAKYGTYYRNLQGIIEHTHYHLGQLVLLKKMLAAGHNTGG